MLLTATVAPVTAQRHLDTRAALSSRNQTLEFHKRACDFYESCTVIYENIIPAVYVAVIDLFMKTAIVLRSVRGSQTTERLQVEVIVL